MIGLDYVKVICGEKIKNKISFISYMYENGNDDIRGVVQWIILEYLLYLNDGIKRNFNKYMPSNLCEAAKEVECYIEDIKSSGII